MESACRASGLDAGQQRSHNGDPMRTGIQAKTRIVGVYAAEGVHREPPGRDSPRRAHRPQSAGLLRGRERQRRPRREHRTDEHGVGYLVGGATHVVIAVRSDRDPCPIPADRPHLANAARSAAEMNAFGAHVPCEPRIPVDDEPSAHGARNQPQPRREEPETGARSPLVTQLHREPSGRQRSSDRLDASRDAVVAKRRIRDEYDARRHSIKPVVGLEAFA